VARGGVDTTREGDEKVPLGKHPLGRGRPSTTFHTFIPVDYPTAAQRRAATTGGTIGIHGPLQIPPGTDLVRPTGDWTLGCIALPTESAVDEAARWLRGQGVLRIIIE
jgi:murein L,D-transpeptidase YafK